MEVHFAPDVQAKLERLASEIGRTPDKLLEDAMAGYWNLPRHANSSTAVMTILGGKRAKGDRRRIFYA